MSSDMEIYLKDIKMRKNESKYKNQDYLNSLINNAIQYKGIAFVEIINNYVYFNCDEHGGFRKRFDRLENIKHHICPKCSKKIYSKIVGEINSKKHTIEEYVDLEKYEPLEKYKNSQTKMKFKCKIHNQNFIATPRRCLGVQNVKKSIIINGQKIGDILIKMKLLKGVK